MSELTIEQRVANGVAHLDREHNGWMDLINLGVLKMSSGCHCILGQQFGDYGLYLDHEGAGDERAMADLGFQSLVVADAAEGGRQFDIAPGSDEARRRDAEYDELEAEWRRVITARREASHA